VKVNKAKIIHSFSPVEDERSRLLILGSMPSVKSLQIDQYYAHPQNAFWYIMAGVYTISQQQSYNLRLKGLRNEKIALWDVVKLCQRLGSLDQAIEHEEANALELFIHEHKHLKKIGFNGQKAFQLFKKHIGIALLEESSIEFEVLPSTSPAMALMTKVEKLSYWKKFLICKQN